MFATGSSSNVLTLLNGSSHTAVSGAVVGNVASATNVNGTLFYANQGRQRALQRKRHHPDHRQDRSGFRSPLSGLFRGAGHQADLHQQTPAAPAPNYGFPTAPPVARSCSRKLLRASRAASRRVSPPSAAVSIPGRRRHWRHRPVENRRHHGRDDADQAHLSAQYGQSGLGQAQDLTNFSSQNGVLLFSADDGINGPELWRSDGNANGNLPGSRRSTEHHDQHEL